MTDWERLRSAPFDPKAAVDAYAAFRLDPGGQADRFLVAIAPMCYRVIRQTPEFKRVPECDYDGLVSNALTTLLAAAERGSLPANMQGMMPYVVKTTINSFRTQLRSDKPLLSMTGEQAAVNARPDLDVFIKELPGRLLQMAWERNRYPELGEDLFRYIGECLLYDRPVLEAVLSKYARLTRPEWYIRYVRCLLVWGLYEVRDRFREEIA